MSHLINITECNVELKGVPGLLVDDPLGDVYKIPTREEISRKKFKVVEEASQHQFDVVYRFNIGSFEV